MPLLTRRLAAALVVLVAAAACRPTFVVTKFPTNEALYKASLTEFRNGHWDNAVSGFDKLTLDLGVRDSLLVPSYWYLGVAHERRPDRQQSRPVGLDRQVGVPADERVDHADF